MGKKTSNPGNPGNLVRPAESLLIHISRPPPNRLLPTIIRQTIGHYGKFKRENAHIKRNSGNFAF